jgi:hypothetical protein
MTRRWSVNPCGNYKLQTPNAVVWEGFDAANKRRLHKDHTVSTCRVRTSALILAKQGGAMLLPGLENLPLGPSVPTGDCANPELPSTGVYAYLTTTAGLVATVRKPGFPTEYRDPATTQLVRKDYFQHGRLTFIELYNAAGHVAFTRDMRQEGRCIDTVYSGDAIPTVLQEYGYRES